MQSNYTNFNGSDTKIWSTDMNKDGFMGFVDKLWILERRIYTIIVLCWIVAAVVIGVFGCTIYNAQITNTNNQMLTSAGFTTRGKAGRR